MEVQLVYRDEHSGLIRPYPQSIQIPFNAVAPSKKLVERLVVDAGDLKRQRNYEILGFVIVEARISKYGQEEIQRFNSFLSNRRINQLMGG